MNTNFGARTTARACTRLGSATGKPTATTTVTRPIAVRPLLWVAKIILRYMWNRVPLCEYSESLCIFTCFLYTTLYMTVHIQYRALVQQLYASEHIYSLIAYFDYIFSIFVLFPRTKKWFMKTAEPLLVGLKCKAIFWATSMFFSEVVSHLSS